MTEPRESEVLAFKTAWHRAQGAISATAESGIKTRAGLTAAFEIHDLPRTIVAQALTEYGQAMRGDWSDIDGRSVRDDMDTLSGALFRTDVSIASLRSSLGLCPHGKGQWDHWCSSYCKGGE